MRVFKLVKQECKMQDLVPGDLFTMEAPENPEVPVNNSNEGKIFLCASLPEKYEQEIGGDSYEVTGEEIIPEKHLQENLN